MSGVQHTSLTKVDEKRGADARHETGPCESEDGHACPQRVDGRCVAAELPRVEHDVGAGLALQFTVARQQIQNRHLA